MSEKRGHEDDQGEEIIIKQEGEDRGEASGPKLKKKKGNVDWDTN